jgi:hypothetical protein
VPSIAAGGAIVDPALQRATGRLGKAYCAPEFLQYRGRTDAQAAGGAVENAETGMLKITNYR